jgi:hypothetical protein
MPPERIPLKVCPRSEEMESLGFRAKGRTIIGENDHYQLREHTAGFGNSSVYESDSGAQSWVEMKNTFLWNNAS